MTRAAVLASCLAIVLVGHTVEGISSDAGHGEVVALADAEVGASTEDITTALQSLGKLVGTTPTPQVHAALEKSFTPALWSSWDREAATQKLDSEASVAVLNSYLCANVDNGNKVMHVMSWIKKALHRRQMNVDPKREALKKAVAALRERVHDTQMLSSQTDSPVASKLAEKTRQELGEARSRLELYESKESDTEKLSNLKKVAADKKAKAENMEKELEDKKAEEDKKEEAQAEAVAKAAATNSTNGAAEKAKEKVKAEEEAEKNVVESESDASAKLDQARAADAKAEQAQNTKVKEQREEAVKMQQTAAKSSLLAQTAASTAAEAEATLQSPPPGTSSAELSALKVTAASAKRKAKRLQKLADQETADADKAVARSDPRANLFKKHVLTIAQENRMANEELLRKEKVVFDEEKAKQAKFVEKKVENDEKIKMAESTLSHAEMTGDADLVTKAHELVNAAHLQASRVNKDVAKSTNALEKSATQLQKVARKQAEHISDDYKEKIHEVIVDGRKMRKKARKMVRAHKVKAMFAKKAAKEASVKASAAAGAIAKAKKIQTYKIEEANSNYKKADSKEKEMDPIELSLHAAKKKLHAAQEEMVLAQKSQSTVAMSLAGNKFAMAHTKVQQLKQKLKSMGRTPQQLRAEANSLEDTSAHEDDIISKANQAVTMFSKAKKESLKGADEAMSEVRKVKEEFLPKVLRHVHRRVAFIEHQLALEVSALNKLGQIKPTKAAAAQDSAKEQSLEAQLDAQKKAAKIKIVHLKKLRTQVNAVRKTAELALEKAKSVEAETEAANGKIKQLKAEACTKADQLEKQLADADKKSASLQSEVTRAQEACQKAGESLTAARAELRKDSQEVATLAAKAQKLEAQYSDDDENVEANEVDSSTQEAAMEKAHGAQQKEKLSAVIAMQRQAYGKEAEAHLMLEAAEKKGNKEEIDTANAALAASKAQVAKLQYEKNTITNNVNYEKTQLGELHSSIRDHVLEIKHDEIGGQHMQAMLGEEQRSAMAEAATTQMQQQVESLTAEVDQERQAKEEEESAMEKQQVDVKGEMQKMKAKLDAIDTAAAAIIDDLEVAIAKGNGASAKKAKESAEEAATKQDLEIADDQLGKLKGLKTQAEDKVKAAEAAAKANATDPAAAEKLEQAKKDLASVSDATGKIATRKETDTEKLSNETAADKAITESDKATGAFAQKLKAKFEKLRNSTESAGDRDAKIQSEVLSKQYARNNTNTKALEERITALEAAVSANGGNVDAIEAGASAANPETEQKINDEKQKLKDVRAKILDLDRKMSEASSKNDTHAQIEVGTEQKDLEVEEKNIKETLESLYKSLEGATDTSASGPVPVGSVPAGSVTGLEANISAAENGTQPEVKELSQDQEKLASAIADAKNATDQRNKLMQKEEAAKRELEAAAKAEKDKIEVANKEKQGLAKKMHDLTEEGKKEKAAVEEAKSKLNEQEKTLKDQEAVANQNMAKVDSKLQSAAKTLDMLNSTAAAAPVRS